MNKTSINSDLIRLTLLMFAEMSLRTDQVEQKLRVTRKQNDK